MLKQKIISLQQQQGNDNQEKEEEDINELYQKAAKELKQMKENEENNSLKMTRLECDLQDARLTNDEIKNESEKLKLEINRLNSLLEGKEGQPIENKEDIEDALAFVENIIDAETSELNVVSGQRAEFIRIISSLEQCNARYDDLLEEANSKIEEFKSSSKSLQTKLDETVKHNEKENEDILNNLIKLSPIEYQEQLKDFEGKPISEKIIELFKYERENKVSKSENGEMKNKFEEELSEREKAMLAHLENAVHCIKMIAESSAHTQTEDEKEYCVNQVKQIQKFINQHGGISEISNIFEFDEPEAQIQSLNEFIDKNETSKTPTVELYNLLKGVLGVNKILFANIDNLSCQNKTDKKKLNKTKNESKQLSAKYDHLRERVDEATEKIRQCIDEPSGEFFAMIDKLIQSHQGMIVENDDQWQTIENLNRVVAERQGNVPMANDPNNYMTNSQEPGESSLIASGGKREMKYKKAIEAYKKKVIRQANELDAAYKQIDAANNTISQLKIDILKLENEKQMAQSAQNAQLQNALGRNEDLRAELTELREKQSQSDSYSSIFNTKEKVMSSEITSLRNRITELEEQNRGMLSELKDKSSSLSARYEAQLRTLNKDLNDTRKMLTQAQIDISDLEKNKTSLQLQIAKLKLADRTKELKLNQMTEFFNNKAATDAANSEAKLLAQKTRFETLIKELNDEVLHCSKVLKELLEQNFDSEIPNDAKLTEITDELVKSIQEMNVHEVQELKQNAAKIQSIYGVEESQGILDTFNGIKQQTDDYKAQIVEKDCQIEKLTKEYENSRAENARNNHVRAELKSWQKWACFMYRKVTNVKSKVSTADIQNTLRDAIVSAACQRPYKQRNEMLLQQKAVLLATSAGSLFNTPSEYPISSFRPLILFAAFNVRMIGFAQKNRGVEQQQKEEENLDMACEKTEKKKLKPIIPISK
ncbi:hypothetical protein TRFO_02183 [Tritrichomonas foetus]|uniref:Uncharacterized protein n=1 Tax=Tritrichomonas foetus TaxID=1144522 RepID=A0A1J4JC41_9EUKA|nr:hypothetical protein [Tritrichomonas foetus]OHS95219.1 hypothetical protein TRFO_02183 [Tritrichomonas foetus]|eukprot:OHS95219.1 hypothetical protein TRFO_02183 [Tritrichomonas foetus]